MFKSLSAVQKALGALPAAMEPSRVNGKWHAPKFSRRKLAELRKAALGFDLPWDWDRERKPVRATLREPTGCEQPEAASTACDEMHVTCS